MSEPWILAVDLGTGGPKTGAVTLSGELLAVAHRTVATTFSDDGGAVQDPGDWWEGIRQGVGEVLAHGVVAGDAVGVGITGQITASKLLNNSRHCARWRARAPSAITQSRWLNAMPRRRSAARLMSSGASLAAAAAAAA